MADSSEQIDYEERRRAWRRPPLWRIGLVVLGGFIVIFAIWIRPSVQRRAGMTKYQKLCLDHLDAPGKVVFDNQPSDNAVLRSISKEYFELPSYRDATVYFANEWKSFYEVYSPPGRQIGATLFLHQRKTPSGELRLVAVDITHAQFSAGVNNLNLQINPCVFSIASNSRSPKLLSSNAQPCLVKNAFVRFYAGQPDFVNYSHFTIVFEVGAVGNLKRGIINGYLRDDDTVVLETPRDQLTGLELK